MEDITLRAINTIGSVEILLCEDTRHTGLLLQAIANKFPACASSRAEAMEDKKASAGRQITNSPKRISSKFNGASKSQINSNFQIPFSKPRLLSYEEFNEGKRIPEVIDFLKQGMNIGLVSDAGTPTISDPGFKLVREAIAQGIRVEAIPGASAILTALVSSGLPTDKFTFLGYLPKKQGKRKKFLLSLYGDRPSEGTVPHMAYVNTLIFYESPFRLLVTLTDMMEILGDIQIVIARELTKIHEEIFRGKISEGFNYFNNKKIQGEITLLIHQSVS